MAVGAVNALVGLSLGVETVAHGYHRLLEMFGYLLVLAALVLGVRRVLRTGLTPRLAALLTTLGMFWLLTGAARAFGGDWYASRYTYPGAVLILVIVAELGRGVALSRRLAIGAAAILVLAAGVNAGWLLKDGNGRRVDAQILSAELASIELSRDHISPDLRFDDRRGSFMTPSGYLAAAADLGSPAMPRSELPHAPLLARQAADALLAGALVGVRPGEAAGRRPPLTARISGSAAAYARKGSRCVAVSPPAGRTVNAVMRLPRTGLLVTPGGTAADRARVRVSVRRFAPTWTPSPAVIERTGVASLIAAATDRSRRPWRVAITANRHFRLC
jgi:hypothetical protein